MSAIATSRGTIGIAERGDGPATPILFLHGVGSDKSVWVPQLEHFGTGRRSVALDYPGYGESDSAVEGTSRDDFADSVVAAMDSLDIDRAHICGLSLGGVVAIALHARAADRCASLIIADSFAVHPDGQAIYDRSVAASETLGMEDLARQRAPLLLAPDVDPDISEEVIATMGRIDPAAYRIGARAVWLADQRDRARAITAPTLILVGDLDPVTPPALSEELGRLIDGSQLEVIAGASHLANLDQASKFNRAVDRFISMVDQKN